MVLGDFNDKVEKVDDVVGTFSINYTPGDYAGGSLYRVVSII